MTITLEYVIVGYTTAQNDKTFEILAYSEGIPSQDILTYQQAINVKPLPIADERQSQSIAMTRFDEVNAILARTHFQNGDMELPVYQYILIPYDVLSGIGARIAPLQTLLQSPIPVYQSHHVTVPPLTLPPISTGNLNARVEQIETLVKDLLNNRFELAMTCLGAMLHERHLVIRNFPKNLARRTDFIQGLRMLLPSAIAIRVSFSSYVAEFREPRLHLTFADDFEDTDRWVIDYERPQVIPAVLEHAYIDLLRRLWTGEVIDFVAEIKPMDILSLSYVKRDDLGENLTELTERFAVDLQVRHDEVVETDLMIKALEGDGAPQGRLRYQYIEKLLQNALNNRDTVAGKLVAEELHRDENLENALSSVFDEMLESQPDTVYVFVRNRLSNIGIDDRWLPRLKIAAKNSLDVAINEGDVQTLVGWLELIAREPTTYELDDILREGILQAQPRARENGELGIRLILITTRRVPDILDQLYNDAELMGALPSGIGLALRETSTETLEALLEDEPQYFLLALFHATQTNHQHIISVPMIERLWTLYRAEDKVNLPVIYRPVSILRQLGTQSSQQMTDRAIDVLLDHIISANNNTLFVEVATHLANRDVLFPRLSNILQNNERSIEQVQAHMNWVADIDNVAPQNISDTYLALLDYWQWSPETQPMIEALARLIGQYPSLDISNRHLWQLFETCNAMHLDSATRVVVNQLLKQVQTHENAGDIVRDTARIYRAISGNKTVNTTVANWWRNFTQTCSLVQLQQINRELEAQRVAEAPREILQSAIAMRKLMGTRDLVEFAEAVSMAYSILENITDAFDKASLEVDANTVRRELDNVEGDLSTEERYVLAKNLRELAQLVTQMSDKRSKPSLMRSDEVIDRQLLHGESTPQGSIDVMKWIAGYLDGAHNEDGA